MGENSNISWTDHTFNSWIGCTNVSPVAGATWFDDCWVFEKVWLAQTDGDIDDEPDLYRVGKKAAGRKLDGELHNAMPEIAL